MRMHYSFIIIELFLFFMLVNTDEITISSLDISKCSKGCCTFLDCLNQAIISTSQELKIYLDGDYFFLFDSDFKTMAPIKIIENYTRIISPLTCKNDPFCSVKAEIKLKTDKLSWDIRGGLIFKNIKINANDIHIKNNSTLSCFLTLQGCCNNDNCSQPYHYLNNVCGLKNKTVVRNGGQNGLYPFFSMNNNTIGFYSNLTFDNCDIINFYAINLIGYYTMIYIDVYPTNILFNNTLLENFYLLEGIVTSNITRRKRIDKIPFSFVFNNSTLQFYNKYELIEKWITFYAPSSVEIPYIIVFLTSNASFLDSKIFSTAYKLIYSEGSTIFFNNIKMKGINMKLNNDFMVVSSSILIIYNLSFSDSNATSKFIGTSNNNKISINNSFIGSCIFNNTYAIQLAQNSSLNLLNSKFYNLTGTIKPVFYCYLSVIQSFNNQFINIINKLLQLDDGNQWNSTNDIFSGFKTSNDTSFFGINKNNVILFKNILFSNISIPNIGSCMEVSTPNSLTFDNISAFTLYSLNKSAFLNIGSLNTISFIDSKIIGSKGFSCFLSSQDSNTISITNSYFSDCYSSFKGGIISGNQMNKVFINSSSFLNIQASSDGGAIFLTNNNVIIIILSSFYNVNSDNTGGVVSLDTSNNILIQNSSFRNCFTVNIDNNNNYSKGGIIFLNELNVINIVFSIFIKSSSTLGGALYAQESNRIFINDSEFDMNQAIQGGCLYIDITNGLTLQRCLFYNSSSSDLGGILIAQTENQIIINDCSFMKASSQIGGVIYLNSYNQMNISKVLMNLTNSLVRGSSLFLNEENVVRISNSTFQNSFSLEESGSIYSNVFNGLYFYQVVFKNISAKLRGGAIFLYYKNNMTMNVGSFINTYADLKGGSFYVSNKNIMNVSNIIIDNLINEFDFTIFYLNNNFFNLSNITLREGCGIYISQFNQGSLENITILNLNYKRNQFTSTMTDDLKEASVNEDKIFIMILSSVMLLKSMQFSHLKYSLISSLLSNVTIENLVVHYNSLSNDNDCYLMMFKLSFVIIKNVNFYFNHAHLFNFNGSTVNLQKFEVLYSGNTYQIFNFFDGNIRMHKGIFKQLPSINQNLNEIPIISFVSKFNFDLSTLKAISITFLYNIGYEGSSLKALNSNLTIRNCAFYMNKAFYSGGAISFIVQQSYYPMTQFNFFLQISNSVFFKNSASDKGGAIKLENFIAKANMTIKFKYNSFVWNKANLGGCFYVKDYTSVNITNALFYNNRGIRKNSPFPMNSNNLNENSDSKGGAVYVNNNFNNSTINYFADLKIINNSADIGGVIFFENQTLILPTVLVIKNNTANLYGPVFATDITKIYFESIYEKKLNKIGFYNLISGDAYDCLFSIIGYDDFGQSVISHSDDISENFNFTSLIIGINPFKNHKLFLKKNEFGSYCSSNKLVPIPFYSTAVDILITYKSLRGSNPNVDSKLNLFLSFRSCIIGEIAQNGYCSKCSNKTYSLQVGLEECIICKETDPFYCYGGADLAPRPGYWRYNYYSDNFISCPNPNSCLGAYFRYDSDYSPALASGECSIGYSGVLCAECSDTYGITDKFFCSKCDDDDIYFYIVASLVIKVIIILFSVHKAMIMCLSLITSNIVNLRKVISSILMKILFNHLQCLIIVFSIPSLIMPEIIKQILHFSKTSSPNITEIISLECALKKMKLSINQQTLKLVTIWTSPVIIILISSGYLAIYLKNKKKKYVIENIYDRLRMWFAIFMTVLMILYPDCMRVCFQTFNCINVGYDSQPHYRLAADYSITCWDTEHWRLIYGAATPFLVILGIGFPLFVLIKLISHWKTNSLNNKTELLKYGYFYFGYDKQFFFWDLVILARKISILLIDVFFLTSFKTITQPVLAIFLVLFVSLYIQMIFQPYRRDKLDLINSLENKSLIALVGTVYVGLLNIEVVFGEKSYSSVFLFVLVFLINLNFAIFWMLAFIKYIISDKLKKWKLALMSCFIETYGFIKRHFRKFTDGQQGKGIKLDHWAMLDKYTIELKKKTRKARQNPLQESLIEQIRKSSLKNFKKRKTTICIKQPERFKCSNCEMTLKIEEENKKLRDELFAMSEKLDNKDTYLKELQTKLSLMKTMIRTNKEIKNNDFDLKTMKYLKSEQQIKNLKSLETSKSVEIEEKKDSDVLVDKLKDHFNLVKCLHQKEKLLSKEKYEISARIFLYTSKDIKKEFYLNFVLYYDFEIELNDMLINYEYDKEKMNLLFLEKKEYKSQDFFLTVEHSLLINITDIMNEAQLTAQIILGDMVDQNIEIPFGFDYLIKVISIPLPQFEMAWNHERFLSLHSNDIGADKINIVTVKKILENSVFFMNFKKHVISENLEEHYAIINVCEVASEFCLKVILKNMSIMRIEMGTSNYDNASLDLMDFILRNLYKKISLKNESFIENI